MEDVAVPTEKLSNENSATQRRTDESAKEVSSQGVKSEAIREPSSNDEPRGKRLKLYNEVIDKSLEEFMHFASFDKFSSMFHQFYKMNRQRMENIHKQFVDELQRAIKDDIRRLNEEASLESKLNELDKLESAAENSPDPAWRPSGVPEQDFSSFIIPFYQKQEAYLRHELRKIQAENAALALKVQAGRERIAQAEHQISTAAAEWEASATKIESLASSLCPADVFDV
ncbi:polyamine-modulated factor 1 [Hippocampus comes]|uniref:Si:dkey-6i22.5 n=1 Tax=Hippocampus comes TaxID=109280 RepID=A0A3Q2Y4N7_HIPCM|nr:PREDICTED: polyamine-modulated factor 1-like [Hippocampus comes]